MPDITVYKRVNGVRLSVRPTEVTLRQGRQGPAGPRVPTYSGCIPNPTARTYYPNPRAEVVHTLSVIHGIQTTTGTLTASLRINGTPVTGWDAIAVTSIPQDLTLGTPVTVPVGAVVTWVLSNVSGSPTDFRFSIPGTPV